VTGAGTQVRALLLLRWQMTRAPGLRIAVVLTALGLGWLLQVVVAAAGGLDDPVLGTVVELAPSVYLGFAGLAVIAPLTAGGGNELVPPDQLVAYPVRAGTQFLGGLVLAPLNLVWLVQLVAVAALTAALTIGGSLSAGALTSAAYVLAVTLAGQALAWTVVGLRLRRSGRRLVVAAGLCLLVGATLVVRSGRGGQVLDASPTRYVSRAVLAGGAGDHHVWLPVTGALLVAALAAGALGVAACGWALRRATDITGSGPSRVRRRPERPGALRGLVAVDRASVWRAPALRRGGAVLLLLPGLLAAGAAVSWDSLVVLPGLVAAGAGLLFGINALSLDGPGAVWLASLPHDPALVLRSKAVVLTETVLAAVVAAALAGAARSPGTPTAGQLSAIAGSALVCTAVVVTLCLRLSVRHPHRAELRGPRDAVAPPGALALASARLALPTAVVGILFGAASHVNGLWPLLLALPLLALCALSLRRSLHRYADPQVRARIVQTVAAG